MTPEKLVRLLRLRDLSNAHPFGTPVSGVIELTFGETRKLGSYRIDRCERSDKPTGYVADLEREFCDDPRNVCIVSLFDAQGARVRTEAEGKEFVLEWTAKLLYDNPALVSYMQPGPYFAPPEDADDFF